MKWNPTSGKSIKLDTKAAGDPLRGTGSVRRPNVTYRQEWDTKRSVVEALQRVTWVYRAVDAIASNAARIPMVLREDNLWDGEIVENKDLFRLLNSKPNEGEDAMTFRYRLSAQLLLSNKGAFIEVTRSKGGDVLSLVLLPPDHMTIIPDKNKLIGGYELNLTIKNGNQTQQVQKKYKPEDVIWIRKPHPFDPYGALTPLAAAGLAIETDWLAKMYNRNFMLNDGRPGGLVVVKGDMTEDDKEELRAKFQGSVARAGRISVIASEDGADFVDTAITPRDAQYGDARKITKEEILMAFGVPETVMANAAGRTFDNAEMERVIFWVETMSPHLDLIVRPLDVIDPDPDTFTSYDLSRVDVLQRMEQKRREFLLRESDAGATSYNEYREATGRPKIENALADIIWIPKTKRGVVTTDGEEAPEIKADAKPATMAVGRPVGDAVTEEPEEEPVVREGDERTPTLPNTRTTPGTSPTASPTTTPKTEGGIVTKEDEHDIPREYEIWEQITQKAVERLIERAARVVSEKASGSKFKKSFFSDATDDEVTSTLFDTKVWTKQLFDDLAPVARGAIKDGSEEDADLKSIRGVNVVAAMEEEVKDYVANQRKLDKPDVQHMGSGLKQAVMQALNRTETHEQVKSFAKHYVDLGFK